MAKFDWVPYLQGKYLSYYQWFGFIGSFVCLILSILNFIAYLILCKIQFHQKKFRLLMWLSNRNSIIDKLKSLTFNAGFIFLSLIPLICQALDIIHLIQGIAGQFAILTLGVFLDNGRKQWNNENVQIFSAVSSLSNSCFPMVKQYLTECLNLTKPSKKKIVVRLLISIAVNVFLFKTCLCFYNSEVGYYNAALGFGINTCLTRALTLKESCPVGAPCQMYTTIPENPSEAIFLNLHTNINVKSVEVYYQQLYTSDVTQFSKVTAQFFPYFGLEKIAQRNVHTALIFNLKPNTKYLTKVFYNGRFWTNAIFKTLPAPGDKKTPIRMINGGDSGYNQAALNLSRIVAKLKPDIFFMGGDIAYDDNMPACAYTWDYFFGMYGKLTATVGYLMPIVAIVGNHDVGLNELPGVNITVSNKGPAYHIYFPQHYETNLDGHIIQKVPAISKRRTLFNFTFGNVHYLALDSGYMHGFDGFQKKFMIDSFEANKDKIKFVSYHVPIYSVCEAFDRDPTRFLYALFHWVPQFDKYHVMTAFQNHVHSFKRTKPLVGSSPTQFGTVYMGDGAYGAIITQMCKPDATMDIFSSYAKKNNFWLSEITENKVEHWAYDSHGELLDHFIQFPQNYTIRTNRDEYKGDQSHEITIEKAQEIVDTYYLSDDIFIPEEKLPYRDQTKKAKGEILTKTPGVIPNHKPQAIETKSQNQLQELYQTENQLKIEQTEPKQKENEINDIDRTESKETEVKDKQHKESEETLQKLQAIETQTKSSKDQTLPKFGNQKQFMGDKDLEEEFIAIDS